MKRVLFIVGMVLLTCTSMMAQSSMTDEQVIKFVMKEQKAGTSQQEIAVKLVQKGVTTDQIKRVQTKVERLKKNQGLGTVEDKTLGEDGRQRKNNGNPRKQKDDNQSTQKLKDKIQDFLNHYQGYQNFFSKYKLGDPKQDPKTKIVTVDISITPFFAAKNFVIKLEADNKDYMGADTAVEG